MNTTKGKPAPEALRMLADWFEEGREIEFYDGKKWSKSGRYCNIMNGEYRAKPEKPQIGVLGTMTKFKYRNDKIVSGIELTPEVIAACKAAGIEVDE